MGHLWPLSKWLVVLEAVGVVVKIGKSLKSNRQIKLSLSNDMKHSCNLFSRDKDIFGDFNGRHIDFSLNIYSREVFHKWRHVFYDIFWTPSSPWTGWGLSKMLSPTVLDFDFTIINFYINVSFSIEIIKDSYKKVLSFPVWISVSFQTTDL